jgi:uracil-DNA glycosylase family 4
VFTGDVPGGSGEWVASGLHAVGLSSQPVSRHREDGLELFDTLISSAVRCAPPGNRPAPQELVRCRPYLEAELRALPRLRVVLALGRIAHETVLAAWSSSGLGRLSGPGGARPRFTHGGVTGLVRHDGRRVGLVASYHPSRQNTQTGRLTRAMWLDVLRRAARLREEDGSGDAG